MKCLKTFETTGVIANWIFDDTRNYCKILGGIKVLRLYCVKLLIFRGKH